VRGNRTQEVLAQCALRALGQSQEPCWDAITSSDSGDLFELFVARVNRPSHSNVRGMDVTMTRGFVEGSQDSNALAAYLVFCVRENKTIPKLHFSASDEKFCSALASAIRQEDSKHEKELL